MIALPLKYAIPIGIVITAVLFFVVYLITKKRKQKMVDKLAAQEKYRKENPLTAKEQIAQDYKVARVVNPKVWMVFILLIGIVLSIFGIVTSQAVPQLVPIFFMFGLMGMLFVGVPVGGLLFKKEIVCKIMKFITKKNYGVVVIVAGKTMIDMIKNLDKDYIKINDIIYIIQKSRIYYNDGVTSQPIDANAVKFSAGIPFIYLDVNSLTPLSFEKDDLNITPEEISAPLKAYAILVEAEFMQYKKRLTLSVLGIILLITLAIGLSYAGYANAKTCAELAQVMNGKLDTLVGQVSVPNIVTQGQ